MTLDEEKAALRKLARAKRRDAAAAGQAAGDALAERFLALAGEIGLTAGPRPVSAYWPMADEFDTRPLMARLDAAGHEVLLPVVRGAAMPLTFRRWRPGTDLVDGGFGTSIPGPAAPEGTPAVLVVPLLAFDDAGYRLGYGGGFYDRTLEKLRAEGGAPRAVGVAYEAQRVDRVPTGEYDQRLDFIVTEVRTRRFGREAAA